MKTVNSYVIILVFCLFVYPLKAEERKTIGSNLKEATVFFKGAELTHQATAILQKGENEIYVEGLSPDIDVNSLKIKSPGGVVISAYEYTIDYLSAAKPSKSYLKTMEDSIESCQDRLVKIEIDEKINKETLKFLQQGISKNISGSEQGIPIDELVKTIDYYKNKSGEVETLLKSLEKERKQIHRTVSRLQSQLEQENMKGSKTSGILKLSLSASRPVHATFSITYFTTQAGWYPYFDVNVESIDKPIRITQKSKVSQTTGMNWEKVKLTLSTSIPGNGKVAPLFSSWFLQERLSQPFLSGQQMLQNSYSYNNTMLVNDANSEPVYVVDGEVLSKEAFASIPPSMVKNIQILKDASSAAIYGSRGSNGVVVVELKDTMDDFVTESDNALNVMYDIDLPYSIPGNGKEQTIDLLVKETLAEYKYYCAPKLDTETYLLAEISDWERLGLLSGRANITYDGTYIGETFIDAASTQSKLTLTLGTDKRVVVKREKKKEYSSSKFMGSDIQQVFTYQITVKNNQSKPIQLVLKDQYPISTQKKIEVNLLKETTAWTANKEDVGVITWEEEINTGEIKTYRISYSVKYPKEMKLNL